MTGIRCGTVGSHSPGRRARGGLLALSWGRARVLRLYRWRPNELGALQLSLGRAGLTTVRCPLSATVPPARSAPLRIQRSWAEAAFWNLSWETRTSSQLPTFLPWNGVLTGTWNCVTLPGFGWVCQLIGCCCCCC